MPTVTHAISTVKIEIMFLHWVRLSSSLKPFHRDSANLQSLLSLVSSLLFFSSCNVLETRYDQIVVSCQHLNFYHKLKLSMIYYTKRCAKIQNLFKCQYLIIVKMWFKYSRLSQLKLKDINISILVGHTLS